MPTSSKHGKTPTKEWIKKHRNEIKLVLDVGCGEGTYPRLLSYGNWNELDEKIIPTATWWGFEAWKPYISEYNLETYYKNIINEDVRQYDFDSLPTFDLIIFGDILEHMTKEEAQILVNKALKKSKYILISIPIKHMPQGHVHGNPFEEHIKDDWTHKEVLSSFPNIVEHDHGSKIGVYWIKSGTV
jgi:2-polyprenyl-3-methyl-5-hydroxy-6-metoxy-1,4-benzoquinol methylase